MEVGAAGDYQMGLRYLAAARRISIASRGLEQKDADILRKSADALTAKGLGLLKQAVRPLRENTAMPPAQG
ncbi:MAG: hypothetical protein JWP35_4652 [Caulobacter sp.]|nr:hypothetical protein [Caulobacter sp.]